MPTVLTGIKELRAVMDRLQRSTHVAMVDAALSKAQSIMARSKADFVPIDTGALRDSGEVSAPIVGDSGVTIELTYGTTEPISNYAVIQHERMDFHHDHGGPKYLERPLMEAANDFQEDIAKKVRL